MPLRRRSPEQPSEPARETEAPAEATESGRGNSFVQEQLQRAQRGLVGGANALAGLSAGANAWWDSAVSGDRELDEEAVAGTVSVHSKIDVPQLTMAELESGSVGHAWVEFQPAQGGPAESWGFWPAGGYSTDFLDSYVGGELREPDPYQGGPGAARPAEITAEEYDQMLGYIEGKRGAQYSLFHYNCTDFAVEAFKAAGQRAPASSVLGIRYPNALYEGIKARNKRDGLDAQGNPAE